LKLLGFTDRDVATKIAEWGFKISQYTLGRQWNKYKSQDLDNHSENFGRKLVLDKDTKQLIIDCVNFDSWVIAVMLSRDKDLNPDDVSADTIETVLHEMGLYTYGPTVVLTISDVNNEKRLDFYQ
jgi:hypothetical protein